MLGMNERLATALLCLGAALIGAINAFGDQAARCRSSPPWDDGHCCGLALITPRADRPHPHTL
jgi:hypothetical protein